MASAEFAPLSSAQPMMIQANSSTDSAAIAASYCNPLRQPALTHCASIWNGTGTSTLRIWPCPPALSELSWVRILILVAIVRHSGSRGRHSVQPRPAIRPVQRAGSSWMSGLPLACFRHIVGAFDQPVPRASRSNCSSSRSAHPHRSRDQQYAKLEEPCAAWNALYGAKPKRTNATGRFYKDVRDRSRHPVVSR